MKPQLGPADNFELGEWNATCDACGRKFKSSQLTLRWDGLMVCQRDWEARHPQDYVRARPGAEPAPLPWSRSRPDSTFIVFCTPNGTSAIPGIAEPGCAIPGYIHPANTLGL
jgi:hypothetical protein